MNTNIHSVSGILRWFPITLVAIALMALPMQAFASHPAGGSCKHDGGLYSICKAKKSGKKCTRGAQKGRCSQHAKGCTCDLGTAAVLENAITDFRETFDVILAANDLPPVHAPLACPQVATVVNQLHLAMPIILPLVDDPDFVSTAFLAEIDSLLRDLQDVEVIAGGCGAPLPPQFEPALVDLKLNYLDTFQDLLGPPIILPAP